MDFDNSSQARSWLFDSSTLRQCRQKALEEARKTTAARGSVARVRQFASGFHRRHVAMEENLDPPNVSSLDISTQRNTLSVKEQELMVRFHAHQISQLVGPTAVLPGLVRSSTILATAIMLFRRFYMSNSVLDFPPRKIAVAAAFLATKVEENRVELDLLEQATALIECQMVKSFLGKQESYYVPAKDIEAGERELMEGLNYEMRCHHPFAAIRVLAKEMSSFLSELNSFRRVDGSEERDPSETFESGNVSPRQVWDLSDVNRGRSLYERSVAVAQNALLCSDVSFLFTPGPIAFAAVAIASRDGRKAGRDAKGHVSLEPELKEFLRVRFPAEEEYDLRDFESQVCKIVSELDDSPVMDYKMLSTCQSEEPRGCSDRAFKIYEIRRVSFKVSALRHTRDVGRGRCNDGRYQSPRKRNMDDEPRIGRIKVAQSKIPKVTPTRL